MNRQSQLDYFLKQLQACSPKGDLDSFIEARKAKAEGAAGGRSDGISAEGPGGFQLENYSGGSGAGMHLDHLVTGQAERDRQDEWEALDLVRRGDADRLTGRPLIQLEALVEVENRPVTFIRDRTFDEFPEPDTEIGRFWAKFNKSTAREGYRERVEAAIPAIGRVEGPHHANHNRSRHLGTGFLVGPKLLMTNRHVAEALVKGVGRKKERLFFKTDQSRGMDFRREHGSDASEGVLIEDIVMIHPYWDMALFRLKDVVDGRTPLTLAVREPGTLENPDIAAIGYPALSSLLSEEHARLAREHFVDAAGNLVFGVKRLAPGRIRSSEVVEWYGHRIEPMVHDSSTLPGNSGSAIIEMTHGQVIGLHFGGAFLHANYSVPAFELARDPRVREAEVSFASGSSLSKNPAVEEAWRRAELEPESGIGPAKRTTVAVAGIPTPRASVQMHKGTATWTIPLQVSVSLGGIPLSAAAASPPSQADREGTSPAAEAAPYDRFDLRSLTRGRFTWKTALSLALASDLAYENPQVILTQVGQWGFDSGEFIEKDDTQCFVAKAADAVLVSFRGTERNIGDWLGNLNLMSTPVERYGRVHTGFLEGFRKADARLQSELADLGARPLLLTGHSLGGALATIAAAEWVGRISVDGIISFGQPAVGKELFPRFMLHHFQGRFLRFVNDDDIVPMVPPTYRHVGRLFHFDEQGRLKHGAALPQTTDQPLGESAEIDEESQAEPPMLTEAEFDRLRARCLLEAAQAKDPGRESASDLQAEGLFPSFGDHSMRRYIAKIGARTE